MAGAVARGIGCSLLPAYACVDGLASGALVEVFPVADLIPAEPWYASTREADLVRPQVTRFADALAVPGADGPGQAPTPSTGWPSSR